MSVSALEDPSTGRQQDRNDDDEATAAVLPAAAAASEKRVRFDERCRVRPIRPHQTLEPDVRKTLWYDREEFKAFKKECRGIMKEALHRLQEAQHKKHQEEKKKKAMARRRRLKITTATGDTITTTLPPPPPKHQEEKRSSTKAKAKATKHLFPPSAFRGLEHFHPKLSLDREERRQEQWDIILTEQAQQDMARVSKGSRLDRDDETDADGSARIPEDGRSDHHRVRRRRRRTSSSSACSEDESEKNLLRLAEISSRITGISAKEAHDRAVRDAEDLSRPPDQWTLPWLLHPTEAAAGTEGDEPRCVSPSPSEDLREAAGGPAPSPSKPAPPPRATAVPKTKLKQLLDFAECGGNQTTMNLRKKVMMSSRSRTARSSASPANISPALSFRKTS